MLLAWRLTEQEGVADCETALVQAMRVTQEQRGCLKLEAYMRLLQELLLVQVQQASITRPSTSWSFLSQVRACTVLPIGVQKLPNRAREALKVAAERLSARAM